METWLMKWYDRFTYVFLIVVALALVNKFMLNNMNGAQPVTGSHGVSQAAKTQPGEVASKEGQKDFIDNTTEMGKSAWDWCWGFLKSLPGFFYDKLNYYPAVALLFVVGVLRLFAKGWDRFKGGSRH